MITATASPSRPRRLLFMTHAESGQANVHLAVISSLLQHHSGEVEIHLASFEALRSRVPEGVTFHAVEGKAMRDTDWPEFLQRSAALGSGFLPTLSLAHTISGILVPYSPAEYVQTAQSSLSIIRQVDPDYTVVDTLFQQAIDAVNYSERRYCLLSPNSLKDVGACDLGLKGLAYPLLGIGYTYPLSPVLLPLNVLSTLHMALHLTHFDAHTRALNAARHHAGFSGPMPLPHPDPDVPVLCMTTPTPGLDYPMPIPDRVICCGPITPRSRPIEEKDPGMWEWLNKEGMETVLISLGTHFRLDARQAGAVWAGVKTMLDSRADIQVLWKLCKKGEYILGNKEERERYGLGQRVRVVDWLESEPVDLLRSGRVGMVVHHGGSNSYHEALAAGVPQVILSGWLDTHDFGARFAYVGVGEWANKRTGPQFDAGDITKAFLSVIGRTKCDTASEGYKRRAAECKADMEEWMEGHEVLDELRARGDGEKRRSEGRDLAGEWIWRESGQVAEFGEEV